MSDFRFHSISENKLIELHQILCMHLYWQDLVFGIYVTTLSYGPWLIFRISFPLNFFRINGQNLTKLCICFDIFTRSTWDCNLSFFSVINGPWLMFLQHEKGCNGDIVKFSDNSSFQETTIWGTEASNESSIIFHLKWMLAISFNCR